VAGSGRLYNWGLLYFTNAWASSHHKQDRPGRKKNNTKHTPTKKKIKHDPDNFCLPFAGAYGHYT
jgi:hypothetical protein